MVAVEKQEQGQGQVAGQVQEQVQQQVADLLGLWIGSGLGFPRKQAADVAEERRRVLARKTAKEERVSAVPKAAGAGTADEQEETLGTAQAWAERAVRWGQPSRVHQQSCSCWASAALEASTRGVLLHLGIHDS